MSSLQRGRELYAEHHPKAANADEREADDGDNQPEPASMAAGRAAYAKRNPSNRK
ncbi:hypothetical protein [Sinomonas gamaensis]|uniref:hypothetical protein n=1 Tax=Sinomonas gamaensis TaxID=2565624 RepID=UPI001486362C|nr:hypothetical protein [Sinomonas gamaensis]